jgi:hypothetical protein
MDYSFRLTYTRLAHPVAHHSSCALATPCPTIPPGAVLRAALCPVVYGNRAVNALGLAQAGLRAQNAPLRRLPFAWSALHATPYSGVLTQLAREVDDQRPCQVLTLPVAAATGAHDT